MLRGDPRPRRSRSSARSGSSAARARMSRPGALVSDALVERLLEAEKRIAARVGRLWDEFDVLLMPIMSRPAPAAQVDGGPRRARHVAVGERLGPVRRALELDRAAGRVGPRRVLASTGCRWPSSSSARRAPRRTLLCARGSDRGRAAVGTPPPTCVRLLACPAAWRTAGSAQGSSTCGCAATAPRSRPLPCRRPRTPSAATATCSPAASAARSSSRALLRRAAARPLPRHARRRVSGRG